MEPWIQTYTGKAFDLANPQPEQLDPHDIVHALAHIGRYTGHARDFYSVAEHTCSVVTEATHIARNEEGYGDASVRLVGQFALLHDAAEAYVGDVSAPLKRTPELAGFRAIERVVEEAVLAKFFPEFDTLDDSPKATIREIVKRADIRMLATEAAVLLGDPPRSWNLPEHEARSVRYLARHAPLVARDQLAYFWNELLPRARVSFGAGVTRG